MVKWQVLPSHRTALSSRSRESGDTLVQWSEELLYRLASLSRFRIRWSLVRIPDASWKLSLTCHLNTCWWTSTISWSTSNHRTELLFKKTLKSTHTLTHSHISRKTVTVQVSGDRGQKNMYIRWRQIWFCLFDCCLTCSLPYGSYLPAVFD